MAGSSITQKQLERIALESSRTMMRYDQQRAVAAEKIAREQILSAGRVAREQQKFYAATARASGVADRERIRTGSLASREFQKQEREKLKTAQATARAVAKDYENNLGSGFFSRLGRSASDGFKRSFGVSGVGGGGGEGGGIISGAISVATGNIITKVLGSVFSQIKEGVQVGFDYNRLKESLMFGYRRKLGSDDGAKQFFDSISKFAAEESPLQIPQAQEQANRLLALRFKPSEVIPLLRAAGDTAAGLGKVGTEAQEKIEQITLALGQMKLKQKVSAEEMTRQLVEAGVDSWGYVAESLQKQYPQYARLTREQAVAAAQDLGEHNRLDANAVVSIIVKGMQRDFGGLGKTINLETVAGKESNVADRFQVLSGVATGSAFERYGQGLEKLLTLLQSGSAERLAGGISATTGGLFEGMESTLKAVASGDIQKLGMDAVTSAASGARAGAKTLYEAGTNAGQQLEKGWRDKLDQHSPSRVMDKLGFEAAFSVVQGFNRGLRQGQGVSRAEIDEYVRQAAERFKVPEELVHAIITNESHYRPNAVSPAGAKGLMQLMPATAARFGVKNIFNPQQNIEGGTAYLRFLLDKFHGDARLVAAAYNSGERNVEKYGGIPPFKETQAYVPRVMKTYSELLAGQASTGYSSPVPVQVTNLPPLQDWLSQFKGSGYKPDVALGHAVPGKPAGGDLRGGFGVFPEQVNPRGFAEWLYYKEKARPVGGGTSTIEQADWQRTISVMAEEMNVSRTGMRLIQDMVAQRLELEKRSLAALSAQGAANGGSFRESQIDFSKISDEKMSRALDMIKRATQGTGELKQEVGTLAQTVTPQALASVRLVASETKGAFESVSPLIKASSEEAERHAKKIADVLTNYLGGALHAAIHREWKELFDSILRDAEDFFVRFAKQKIQERLLKALSPNVGGSSSGGGWQGAGQSVGDGGSIVNSFRKHGFVGGLKNLFGFGSSAATSATSSAVASGAALPMGTIVPGSLTAAALASWGAGGAAATGAGVGAGALSMGAGSGAAAGTTGASAGMMGLLTNPWTIGIAAAAIGGFALWNHFRNRTEKALRKTIKGEYQVDVKEMPVLKEIKALGEQVFGKGQVSKHLQETVRLDQAKELIVAYAERTNQTASSLVANRQLADATDPRNQFTARMFGGRVDRGVPYVVGEHRPELFVPDVSGRIEPRVNEDMLRQLAGRMPMAFLRKRMLERLRSQASDNWTPSGDGGGGAQRRNDASPALMAAMVNAVQQSNKLVGELRSKLRSMSPTDVLRVAAEDAPEVIGNANAEALKSGSVRQKQQDGLGMRR
jgi:hypothetical protein